MSEPQKPEEKAGAVVPHDPYWWTPWAVLVGLLLYGLFGFIGKFSSKPKGPTAADVPAQIAPPEPSSDVKR